MSKELTLTSILFLLVILLFILRLVKKRRISIKYSLVWVIPCVILIIFALIPGLMGNISKFLGFQTSSNMVLTVLLSFLMIICIALTSIVTNQKDKIRLLIQEVSILKEESRKK